MRVFITLINSWEEHRLYCIKKVGPVYHSVDIQNIVFMRTLCRCVKQVLTSRKNAIISFIELTTLFKAHNVSAKCT